MARVNQCAIQPMFYTFTRPDLLVEPFRISALTPHNGVGLIVLLVAAVLLFAVKRGRQSWLDYLPAAVAFVGSFILTHGFADEVFVNLEHPWNLSHHGRFSFDPTRMVDGTVEGPWYLLLTPFAANRPMLIYANYALGFTVGFAHLLVLGRLLAQKRAAQEVSGLYVDDARDHQSSNPLTSCATLYRPILLLAIPLNLELMQTFSRGFGNGGVSLVVLIAIACQLRGRWTPPLILAGVLPLLRPDGILWSACILAADFVVRRRARPLAWIAPFVSLAIVLAVYKIVYGHAIPTPVAFKSFEPWMIKTISPRQILRLGTFFLVPIHLIAFAWAFFAWRRDRGAGGGTITLGVYLLLGYAIFTFYALTAYDLNIYASRYYVGLEIAGSVAVAWLGVRWIERWRACSTLRLAAIAAAAVALTAGYELIYLRDRVFVRTRVDSLAYGGQTLDRLVPADWSIASTEMSTVGFMLERPVIDLWGYTNPEIAHARIVSRSRVRNVPDLFLRLRPEVEWLVTEPRNSLWLLKEFESYLPNVGKSLALYPNTKKNRNQLGDMNEVLRQYAVMRLLDRDFETILFVRNDRWSEFAGRLATAGFAKGEETPIDAAVFARQYAEEPDRSFRKSR